MAILNNSPLQSDYNQYINKDEFDSRLFFTSTYTTLNYIVLRSDGSNYNVIATGKLNGYNLNYRFDFGNYIKIDNQDDITPTNLDIYGNIYFNGNCSSNLYLMVSNTDIFDDNSSLFIQNTDGTIYTTTNPNLFVYNQLFNYRFWDKDEQSYYNLETVDSDSDFISIRIYSGTTLYFESKGEDYLIAYNTVGVDSGYDYKVVLLNLYKPVYWLAVNLYYNSVLLDERDIYPLHNRCYNKWYFFNPNGAFDSIKTTGINDEITNITRESITVGNKIINTSITNQKQIKQNSGLLLEESQIRGLLNSPIVYKLNADSYISPNLIENGRLTDLSNGQYGNTSIVYLTKEENFTRFFPTGSTTEVSGMSYVYSSEKPYVLSLYVRHYMNINLGVTINISNTDYVPETFYMTANTWTRIVTSSFTGTDVAGILTLTLDEPDHIEDAIYSEQGDLMETEDGQVIYPEFGIVLEYKKLKIEYGVLPTEWTNSVTESPATFKEYSIDTTSFSGYNGLTLGERNIELIFTDPHSYKRRINHNLTFFD